MDDTKVLDIEASHLEKVIPGKCPNCGNTLITLDGVVCKYASMEYNEEHKAVVIYDVGDNAYIEVFGWTCLECEEQEELDTIYRISG